MNIPEFRDSIIVIPDMESLEKLRRALSCADVVFPLTKGKLAYRLEHTGCYGLSYEELKKANDGI